MKKIDRKDDDNMLHGMDGSKAYKYDLPVVNEPMKLRNDLMVVEEEVAETQVQKLFEILDCDKDTAYESFMIKFSQEFNHEVDMYGDI